MEALEVEAIAGGRAPKAAPTAELGNTRGSDTVCRLWRVEERTHETLTLAVGLRPRTRIAKVFALRLVAVRRVLCRVGGWQAIGEAGDRRQALRL